MKAVWEDATDVKCSVIFVCMLKNMGEPIEILFGGLTHMGWRNHVLDGSQDRTNPFAAARDSKMAMQSFA